MTLGSLIGMYQHFLETIASINTVDNRGIRHIAKMCITPYSRRILVATITKNYLCISHTVGHNYISSSSTVGIQLHVSALYVGHLQVVI